MALSYEAADALFRKGHYRELISRSDLRDAALARLTPAHRLLLARALMHIDPERASEIAQHENTPDAPPAIRSTCELVMALTRRRQGAFEEALARFQRAVQLAREAGDIKQIAWAYLHLFRVLAETQPHDAALAVLGEARTYVTRAGDPHAAAFMHDSIALVEGSTGRIDEARRHLDISAALLDKHPNDWLGQLWGLSAFCVNFLGCDYAAAAAHLQKGKRFLSSIGGAHASVTFATNEGHAALVTGHFAAAEERLQRAASSSSNLYSAIGALDGLAMLYIATGRVDDCEKVLTRIDSMVAADPKLLTAFTPRWAAPTRIKLHLRQGRWELAYAEACDALTAVTALQDQHMIAAVLCLKAEAATAAGRIGDATRSILAASLIAPELVERQAQFHHSVATLLDDAHGPLATRIRSRAHAIWDEQGNRLGPLQNVDSGARKVHGQTTPHADTTAARELPARLRPAAVTNALASAFDLAGNPRLLGAELVDVITTLKCSPRVTVVEERTGAGHATPDDNEQRLPLGRHHGKDLTLVCRVPDDPLDAVMLTDVLRLARASLALEQARQEERNRAAVWPAEPVEEQVGALFLAQEMQALLSSARRIAPTTLPILITGETGTGKEVLARIIHAYSSRASGPFLPFTCNSVPRDMLDSQLFGHRRGAFTGAIDSFPGVIRAAAGGTLFLDEIGEATLDVQPKLLRFLEAGEIHPIGETQPVHVNVRIIAATNADLDALVAEGKFREDLFYRLNIVRLHVLPLRERRVEIPELAAHYLQKHARELQKGHLRLAEETIEYLVLYRWPGNVRQLANEMRRLAAFAEPDAVLMPEHLAPEIAASRRTVPASEQVLDPNEVVIRLDQPMAAAMEHLERAMVQFALASSGGHMEQTAAMLGLSRKGLYLKRHRFGFDSDVTPLRGGR
jgi:DNA-binding NtrC family response regulator